MSHPGSAAPSVEERIAEIETLLGKITRGKWQWHLRRDDNDAPASIYAEPFEGHAYAVAMAPRYQKPAQFAADAEFIVRAHAIVPWLIAELRARDEALREARKDSARFDWLRESGDDTGWCARESTTGRGYRLHQPGPWASPRDAIDAASTSLARTEGGDVEPDGSGASR